MSKQNINHLEKEVEIKYKKKEKRKTQKRKLSKVRENNKKID
ncbi:MAG: hypothetical protein US81_C0037G0005 [Parcubacteria group bacterium GW2011_GWE2_38_18]|nr:MAG: hypothetical protein US81_C0037G0005 [Parcubacteria group bacterium GW2011_GWE2_38_18]